MKQFTIPFTYRSPLLAAIKNKRKQDDKMKKDFAPFLLDFGNLKIYLARHFGFCYGVENAIEIAFQTIETNRDKRVFLLSEMIHNPLVNQDLRESGVQFLQDTTGKQLIPFESLSGKDIVLIPAFGTSLDIEQKLRQMGIAIENYNTTCPFVEKVWNRSSQIGQKKYTIVVHGKPSHEETRATFSHAAAKAPSIIVKDMKEAILLSTYITGKSDPQGFFQDFEGRYSKGFDPLKDLARIGVVNQTTMLASDTQAIADHLKQTMIEHYSLTTENIEDRFADTRDTLCYATLDNQSAVTGLLNVPADFAVVVGGYNSSNTSHLVELCEEKLPTYFISDENKILSSQQILHYDLRKKAEVETKNFLPEKKEIRLLITSGASCPDAVVEQVIARMLEVTGTERNINSLLKEL